MIRKALSLFLVGSILYSGSAWSRAAPIIATPAESTQPKLEAEDSDWYQQLIGELRAGLDRSQFDLSVLIEELDSEPDRIVQFVRQEIAFEQYPGLLRGATGTLMSRAGNALDQAVLLATLLKDSGQEARIQRTTLTEQQATTLLNRLQPAQRPASPWKMEPSFLAAESRSAVSPSALPTEAEIDMTVDAILDALAEAQVLLGDPEGRSKLLEEARNYFWVEHRPDSSSDWLPLQPVFEDPYQDFSQLKARDTLTDTVPKELQHRLRLQVFIEQKFRDELRVHAITDPWEQAAANLAGSSLTYLNYPSNLTPENAFQDRKSILEETALFVPILNGKLAPGAHAFDANGIPFALDSMGMDSYSATALFQTLGNKVEKAASALGRLGSKKQPAASQDDLITLTAQWIDYTLIAPGGEESTVRRYLRDRLGPLARLSHDFSALRSDPSFGELFVSLDLVAPSGVIPESFLLDQTLKEWAWRNKAATWFYTVRRPEQEIQARVPAESPPAVSLLHLLRLSEVAPGLGSRDLTYRSGPGVISLQRSVSNEGSTSEIVDIVANSRRGFSRSDESWEPSPETVLRNGVWETFTERVALAKGDPHPLQKAAHLEPQVYLFGPSSNRSELEWQPNVMARLDSTTSLGHQVLVPVAGNPDSWDGPAWWRTNPKTGETLGVISSGHGGDLLETIAIISLVTIFVCSAILSPSSEDVDRMMECDRNAQSRTDFHCCMELERADRKLRQARESGSAQATRMAHATRDVILMECGQIDRPLPPPTRPQTNGSSLGKW